MKASLGTSTLPISLIFFFPSACFFRSFIFRVMSPPYCKHRHEFYAVVCNVLEQCCLSDSFVLTHLARTFFLYALTLKEEHTEWIHLNTCSHVFIKPLNENVLTFLLQLFCLQGLLVQRPQTFVEEWYLWDAHTWISLCCMPGPCKDKYHQNSPAGYFVSFWNSQLSSEQCILQISPASLLINERNISGMQSIVTAHHLQIHF